VVLQELFLTQTQNLEGLFLSDETAFDPESFVGDLLAAFVRIFFKVAILTFFIQKPLHSEQALIARKRSNHGRILTKVVTQEGALRVVMGLFFLLLNSFGRF
jgi:uncharacterized membrane protein